MSNPIRWNSLELNINDGISVCFRAEGIVIISLRMNACLYRTKVNGIAFPQKIIPRHFPITPN